MLDKNELQLIYKLMQYTKHSERGLTTNEIQLYFKIMNTLLVPHRNNTKVGEEYQK